MISRKKQHNEKTMLYIGIGIVILIIFLAVFGLNSLIGSSLFISNLISGKETAETESGENFFGTLHVDTPPLATNSAQIIFTGTVTGFDHVAFYINNEQVEKTPIGSSNSFSQQIGNLTPGDNEIYAQATTSGSDKTKKSEIFTVSYSNEKPTLTITEPSPDSTTHSQEIYVKGTTTGSEAKINGYPVIVDAQGQFETSVRLQEGDNTITVYVENDAGNSEQTEFIVRYEKEE